MLFVIVSVKIYLVIMMNPQIINITQATSIEAIAIPSNNLWTDSGILDLRLLQHDFLCRLICASSSSNVVFIML